MFNNRPVSHIEEGVGSVNEPADLRTNYSVLTHTHTRTLIPIITPNLSSLPGDLRESGSGHKHT